MNLRNGGGILDADRIGAAECGWCFWLRTALVQVEYTCTSIMVQRARAVGWWVPHGCWVGPRSAGTRRETLVPPGQIGFTSVTISVRW